MLTRTLVIVPANSNAKEVLAPLAEFHIGVTTFQEGVYNVVSGSECGACVVRGAKELANALSSVACLVPLVSFRHPFFQALH